MLVKGATSDKFGLGLLPFFPMSHAEATVFTDITKAECFCIRGFSKMAITAFEAELLGVYCEFEPMLCHGKSQYKFAALQVSTSVL